MDEQERTIHLLMGCKACQWRVRWADDPHAFCPSCGHAISRRAHVSDHFPDACDCEVDPVEP